MRRTAALFMFVASCRFDLPRLPDTTSDDGGIDASVMLDGPPAVPCPADFVVLPNDATNPHRYRALKEADWDTQRQACIAFATKSFIGVPSDAIELAGLSMLTGNAKFWVGIDDRSTEGTFVQATGGPATFLPWDTGQPDNTGTLPSNADCVISPGTTIRDESCDGVGYPAVCECVP